MSPYESVEYYNINTTVVNTRVSNVMVHLFSSVLHKMTEEVYSFGPGLLKPANLLSAIGILLCWVIGDVSLQVLVSCSVEVLDEAVRVDVVELGWMELVIDDFRALLGL